MIRYIEGSCLICLIISSKLTWQYFYGDVEISKDINLFIKRL